MMRWVVVVLLFPLLLIMGCTGRNDTSSPISESDLLFTDEFVPGETGRWRIEGDAIAASTLQNEALNIAVNEAETVHYATLDNEFFSDFVLDVETKLLSGNPENSFGILFRMEDPQQFYRFEMTGNGLFIVERRDGEVFTRLTNGWLDAAELVQGVGAENRVQVRAVGDKFTFIINDAVVAELTDSTFTQGNIAFDAGTFARPGIAVAFDNLVVSRP